MTDLLSPARLVDLALVVLVLEAAALLLLRGRAATGLLPTLAAGGCVLLAWRAMAAGLGLPWVGTALAAALACHWIDLRGRLPPRR